MALILVIEDDPATRMLHASALANLAGSAVVVASTMVEARALFEHSAPDLVLLDLRLPDGTGLDLLPLLAALKPQPAVLVVSAFLAELPAAEGHITRLSVISKPLPPEALRCHVLEALQLERTTSMFSLPEYVQMACLGGHSVILQVTAERAAGFVAIRSGEVWAAKFGELESFEAFYAMASRPNCAIEVRPWLEQGLPPRQLAGGYQELLLEAARRHDEQEGSAPALAVDDVDYAGLLQSLGRGDSFRPEDSLSATELVTRAVRAVVARDYAHAVGLFERAQALEPQNAGIRHRLERLYELGYRRNGT